VREVLRLVRLIVLNHRGKLTHHFDGSIKMIHLQAPASPVDEGDGIKGEPRCHVDTNLVQVLHAKVGNQPKKPGAVLDAALPEAGRAPHDRSKQDGRTQRRRSKQL
jgi:hypothetical protein